MRNLLQDLRSVRAIMHIEWKLQVRSIVFWAVVVLLVAYAVALRPSALEASFLQRSWQLFDLFVLLSVGLIFIVPSALARDKAVMAFIRTTPISSGIYLAGKLGGVLMAALSLLAIQLLAVLLMRVQAWALITPERLLMIVRVSAILTISTIYLSCLYFVITILARQRLILAYVLCGIYFFFAIGKTDVADLLSYLPIGITFFSDAVGHGIEETLHMANQLFYASLVPMLVAVAFLMYPAVERLSLALQRGTQLALIALLSIGLGLSGVMASNFVRLRSAVIIDYTPLPALTVAEGAVTDVEAALTFEPNYNQLSGTAAFKLQRAADSPSEVLFHVPHGLVVSEVSNCAGERLENTLLDVNTLRVAFAEQLCLTFSGRWLWERIAHNSGYYDIPHYMPLFMGSGYLYLTPNALFFPAPIGGYVRTARHTLSMTLPQPAQVISPMADEQHSTEGAVTYVWHSAQGRPRFTVVSGIYQAHVLADGAQGWLLAGHQAWAEQVIMPLMDEQRALHRLLGYSESTWHYIEVPELRHPLVAGNWLLVPEHLFQSTIRGQPLDRIYANILSKEEAYYRFAIFRVRGFIDGTLHFAEPLIHDLGEVPFVDRRHDFGTAYKSLDYSAGRVPLREAFAHYLTLQLVDLKFNTQRLEKVLDNRLAHVTARKNADPRTRQVPFTLVEGLSLIMPPYEMSWQFTQALSGLKQMEKRLGRAATTQLIGAFFVEYRGGNVNMADWLAFIEERTGSAARGDFEAIIRLDFTSTFNEVSP